MTQNKTNNQWLLPTKITAETLLGSKSNSTTGMEFAIRYTGWISSLQATHSAVPANTRIETLVLTRVRDNIVQIRESGGGMASSHWGMYSRLPTLRVLTLRLRDVQFWLPIRNDRSWGRGYTKTSYTPSRELVSPPDFSAMISSLSISFLGE